MPISTASLAGSLGDLVTHGRCIKKRANLQNILQCFLSLRLFCAELGNLEIGCGELVATLGIVPHAARYLHQPVAQHQHQHEQTPRVAGRHSDDLQFLPETKQNEAKLTLLQKLAAGQGMVFSFFLKQNKTKQNSLCCIDSSMGKAKPSVSP